MPEQQEHYSDGMPTEMLMRSVFGDRFYGRATPYQNPRFFKRDLKMLLKKLSKDVENLIASDNFKASCKLHLEQIEKNIQSAESGDDFRKLLVEALKVVTNFMGYHYQSGVKRVEPYFIPSTWQDRQGWREAENYYKFKDHMRDERKKIVKNLKSEGKTNSEVAELLNITNYKVAQILKELREENEL